MFTRYQASGYLFTGNSANGAGSAIDARGSFPAAFVQYAAAGASAIFGLQASHDSTAWTTFATVTAITGAATTTAILSISAYYPYVRGQMTAYSGAAGTATLWLYYGAAVV